MNKRFQVQSWLGSTQSASAANIDQNLSNSFAKKEFQPSDFLIPSWKGESLLSKPAQKIKTIQKKLVADAVIRFKNSSHFNRSLKRMIYKEYCDFINLYESKSKLKSKEAYQLSEDNFWEELPKVYDNMEEVTGQFIQAFCFRTVSIYLFKIKFIISFAEKENLKIQTYSLLNPTSFIQQQFKRGSSTELICDSLLPNQYSWYRPGLEFNDSIQKTKEYLLSTSISEMMKLSSYDYFLGSSNAEYSVSDNSNDYFSHSLSHKDFGLFINQLLIFLPIWITKKRVQYPQRLTNQYPSVLNTKFSGESLSSLCHSHWLAQESNLEMYSEWSEIICPSFDESDKLFSGSYTQFCHEIQFLTFMVEAAASQGLHSKKFLAETIKKKYALQMQNQICLFPRGVQEVKNKYQRVVLNLSNSFDQNPYNEIINQILKQQGELEDEGFVYVFSNQKLFIPSQKSKLEKLLKVFKLETVFDFSNLKYKGEVSHYLYTLRKRGPLELLEIANQESSYNFRLSGSLTQFNKFSKLSESFKNFIVSRSPDHAIFQEDLGPELSFEYYKDVLMDSCLLTSSASKDDNIAHPQFFKRLTNSSAPFQQLFNIKNIEKAQEKQSQSQTGFLGIQFASSIDFPFVLVVDYSAITSISIKIVPGDIYQETRNELGNAYYKYFGLIPKIPNIDIKTLNHFLKTDLGLQIIQMALSGNSSRLKSKLKGLLIHRLFLNLETDLDTQQKEYLFEIKSLDKNALVEKSPTLLEAIFENIENEAIKQSHLMPLEIVTSLSELKAQIDLAFKFINYTKTNNDIVFNNSYVQDKIVQLKPKNLLNNDEVFIETISSSKEELLKPFYKSQIYKDDKGQYSLGVISKAEVEIVKLHADHTLLKFIQFVLNSAKGYPVLEIIQKMSIVSVQDLNLIVDQTKNFRDFLSLKSNKIEKIIQKVFVNYINR